MDEENSGAITFEQVLSLVNEGERSLCGVCFYVADADFYGGRMRKVFFAYNENEGGYELIRGRYPIEDVLVKARDLADRENEWRLEAGRNEGDLNLCLYRRTALGDMKLAWVGSVFSNAVKVKDALEFIERRQKELKKKRK